MPRSFSDEAVILKAHDVGEADRLCILFTKGHGKLAVRAAGVRRLKSRKGGSMLALQLVRIQLKKGNAGYMVNDVECLATHDACRADMSAYKSATSACTLVLKFLEDEESMQDVYGLLAGYLHACRSGMEHSLLSFFIFRLLEMLGTLPSMSHSVVSHRLLSSDDVRFSTHFGGLCTQMEDSAAHPISAELFAVLGTLSHIDFAAPPRLSAADQTLLASIAHSFVGNQLGFSVSSPLSVASSSSVTPT